MQVIFSGAQRVGKTTLAREISNFFGLQLMDTKVSKIIEKMGSDTRSHLSVNDVKKQIEIQTAIFDHIANFMTNSQNIVLDRGLIDVIAYSRHCMYSAETEHDIFQWEEVLSKFEQRACHIASSKRDTYSFIVQPGIKYIDDASKAPETMQKFINNDCILSSRNIDRCFIIPSAIIDLGERFHYVKTLINNFENRPKQVAKLTDYFNSFPPDEDE